MHERFTDRASAVMQLANGEARRLQHEYIGTEHMLLGLIEEGGGVAAEVFAALGIGPTKLRQAVERLVQPGADRVAPGKLPHTPRAKQAIEYAIEESGTLHHNYVGTEHLLLVLRHPSALGLHCNAHSSILCRMKEESLCRRSTSFASRMKSGMCCATW